MFADNNRISWLQMRCQFLLAALGVGLLWGIPGFTGREGAVGILIGGALLACWSGILRRQMTVFRDPIRYFGKTCAWLLAGIWESYLVLTGGWLVAKVGHLGRGISGLRGAGDDAFPCVRVCGTGRFPSCTGTGTAGADFLGDRGVAGRNLTVAGRKAIGDSDGWSAAGTGSF